MTRHPLAHTRTHSYALVRTRTRTHSHSHSRAIACSRLQPLAITWTVNLPWVSLEEIFVVAGEEQNQKRAHECNAHRQEGHREGRLVTEACVHDDRCEGVRHRKPERGTDTDEL